jgi:CheY-like chemotaxis protein
MASVLVIEDDPRIRETIVRSITDGGPSVRAEGRGADALGAVIEWCPDVVVLDHGTREGGSNGLGLDIAVSTARTAGGELRIERSRLGGARIVLDLPTTEDLA